MLERGGERALLRAVAPTSGGLPSTRKVVGEARRVLQLGELLGGQPRLAARHRVALAGLADRACRAARRAAAVPPSACAASSASIQPPTAPGTVSAASGPRDGIAS